MGQTGQSDAIHSPEACASVVVKLTIPAVWSMAVVCKPWQSRLIQSTKFVSPVPLFRER